MKALGKAATSKKTTAAKRGSTAAVPAQPEERHGGDEQSGAMKAILRFARIGSLTKGQDEAIEAFRSTGTPLAELTTPQIDMLARKTNLTPAGIMTRLRHLRNIGRLPEPPGIDD